MPNFEVFTKGMVPVPKEPMVTLQKHGVLSLNAAAVAALGSPAAVELLYDRAEQIIGLRPAEAGAPNAYPVWSGKGSAPAQVSAAAFTRYYEIRTGLARRRVAVMNDGVLCIDLKQLGTITSRGRKDAKPADPSDRPSLPPDASAGPVSSGGDSASQ